MNGKQARRMRQAARMIAGPDAHTHHYEAVQQRDANGGKCVPRYATHWDGRPRTVVVRHEARDPLTHRRAQHIQDTGVPLFVSTGQEPRNSLDSVRGLYRRIKGNYRRIKGNRGKALDSMLKSLYSTK